MSNPFGDPLRQGEREMAEAATSAVATPSHVRQRSLGASSHSDSSSAALAFPRAQFALRGPTDSFASNRSSNYDFTSQPYTPTGRSFGELGTLNSPSRSRYDILNDAESIHTPNEERRSFDHMAYQVEDDDALHDAGPPAPRVGKARMIMETDSFRGNASFSSVRGYLNMGFLVILCAGLLTLFAGYPVMSFYQNRTNYVNTTSYIGPPPAGAQPTIAGTSGLINDNAPKITKRNFPIDPDTPQSAYTKTSTTGTKLKLVFSDEFNDDDRLFYPGMDPYWEAANLHYWQTGDMEWYDPDNVFTQGGALQLTLTQETLANSHNTGYLGGMIQSWNKFCFTGGRIEAAVSLPGHFGARGFWPAVWLLGNLGRVGYGASLDGMWPYSYDTCDIGTLPNQTDPKGGPTISETSGAGGESLSWLQGQKLSACTCAGEDHPGPIKADGSFTGRSAAEIDLFEALVLDTHGNISQSAQFAPFNPYYTIINGSANLVQYFGNDGFYTAANGYGGGVYQQAASATSWTDSTTYESTTNFGMYGVDYVPSYINGDGTGHISWLQGNKEMWRLYDTAMGPNAAAKIGQRTISGEPMSIIANLGMSESFAGLDLNMLKFPGTMRIDWIRVYQDVDAPNYSCDPPLFPTKDYIERHAPAYNNPNLTTWQQYTNASDWNYPKNRLTADC